MLKFWFKEDVAALIVERYANWRSLTDSEAFLDSPDEVQLGTADVWISAVIIGKPFTLEGSEGWQAVEVLVNSNAPSSALQRLFESLGGFLVAGVQVPE